GTSDGSNNLGTGRQWLERCIINADHEPLVLRIDEMVQRDAVEPTRIDGLEILFGGLFVVAKDDLPRRESTIIEADGVDHPREKSRVAHIYVAMPRIADDAADREVAARLHLVDSGRLRQELASVLLQAE